MNRSTTLVLIMLLSPPIALAGELSPPAGAVAPTMKDLDDVSPRTALRNVPSLAGPVVIVQPGSYYLAEDITAIGGEHGIQIQASHVTLDFNGFQVIGSEIGSLNGIEILDGLENIALRNGTVRNFMDSGVRANLADDVRCVDLRVFDNGGLGIWLGRGIVDRCNVHDNTTTGIQVGNNSLVLNSTAILNGQHGMSVGQTCSVENCTARDSDQDGIIVGAFSTITNCSSSDNGSNGFRLISGSTAIGCSAVDNGNSGFEVQSFSSGVSILHCVARVNPVGIRLRDSCVALGNGCHGNLGDGILVVGQSNRIDSNSCTGNGDDGIDLNVCGNLCVRNSLARNTSDPIEALACFMGNNLLGALSTNPATAGPWDNFEHSGP